MQTYRLHILLHTCNKYYIFQFHSGIETIYILDKNTPHTYSWQTSIMLHIRTCFGKQYYQGPPIQESISPWYYNHSVHLSLCTYVCTDPLFIMYIRYILIQQSTPHPSMCQLFSCCTCVTRISWKQAGNCTVISHRMYKHFLPNLAKLEQTMHELRLKVHAQYTRAEADTHSGLNQCTYNEVIG